MKAAQQSEVLIYAVGLLSEEERREAKRAPERALEALAEATGGETFFPKDVSEVERIAHQVAHDIRNQYTIAYTPSNTAMDGTFRQIKVTVNAPGNPTVRTRSGYYATPDQGVRPAKSAAGPDNAPHSLAPHSRVPPAAVAQPLSALAHGDLLGLARGGDHVRAILGLDVAAALGDAAVPALGGADGARAQRDFTAETQRRRVKRERMKSKPESAEDGRGKRSWRPCGLLGIKSFVLFSQRLSVSAVPFRHGGAIVAFLLLGASLASAGRVTATFPLAKPVTVSTLQQDTAGNVYLAGYTGSAGLAARLPPTPLSPSCPAPVRCCTGRPSAAARRTMCARWR